MEPQLSGSTASPPINRAWFRFGNKRTRITAESILLGLAIVCAVAWYSAPYLARDYINRGLLDLPDYAGRVEWVRIHPWTASMDIYDVHLDKRTRKVPVSFFYSPRWTISLQWSQIFHGVQRASVVIDTPRINFVTGPNPEQSQMYISLVWIDAIKQMIPWRVNQVQIHGGDVHFLHFHASPKVDLEVSQLELDAENMSNSQALKIPLPAIGRPITDIVTALDYPALAEDAHQVLKKLVAVEKQVPARNGHWFTVRIMPYSTLESRVDGLVITFADITVAKNLEVALRKAQSELETRFTRQTVELGKTQRNLQTEIKKRPRVKSV